MLIKLINFVVLIISFYLSTFCLCYEVPNVKLNLLINGFSLTIPDDPGLRQVVYIIKVNNECPTLMDIVLDGKPSWQTTQTSKILKPLDKLYVSILVNYQGNAYKSYQYFTVGDNNEGIKSVPPNSVPPNSVEKQKCGRKMLEINCQESETIVLGMVNVCKGQLIFEDDFTEAQLNRSKWSYDIRHRLIGTEFEEFVVLDDNRENIFIHDGYLNIRPTITQEKMKQAKLDFGTRCTPVFNKKKECELMPQPPFIYVPPINSSQILTANKFEFKYGKIEIKAKLPKGDWILPYVMLQSYGVYEEKQIRIAFARGNEHLLTTDNLDLSGKVLFGGIVTDVENNVNLFHRKTASEHYGDNFHVYTLIWKPNEISLEVDGIKYGTIKEHLNDFNRSFFITLGVSAGGHLNFPDNLQAPNKKPWKNTSPRAIRDFWLNANPVEMLWTGNETLQVDYVKVYAI